MNKEDSWSRMLSNPDFKHQFNEVVHRSNKNNINSCVFFGVIPDYEKVKSSFAATGLDSEQIMLVFEALGKTNKDFLLKEHKNKILIIPHDFNSKDINPLFKIVRVHTETTCEQLKNQIFFILKND